MILLRNQNAERKIRRAPAAKRHMQVNLIADPVGRRSFIGGSDRRISLADNETALIRLWQQKRGQIEPEDFSGNLIVQLGLATEDLNRRWYEANTGQVVIDIQKRIRHPALRWMAATLD